MKEWQDIPATHNPMNGVKLNTPIAPRDAHWREEIHVWYFNPWTGTKRFLSDVTDDPHGLLIQPPGALVFAASDAVNHPSHYGGASNPYEAIKVIEAWGLNFNLGNTTKYISRAGKKDDTVQDLKKARWYLDREITNREKAIAELKEKADVR